MSALDGLLDDAALFPPGEAPMPVAVPAHLARAATPDGALVGPFVCPADRLDELAREVDGRGMDVAVVADEPFEVPTGLRVVAVETRRFDAVPVPTGARLVVELRCHEDAAVPRGALVKLRTGGIGPDAVPSPPALAAALGRLVRRGQPFKLTAGLHHAIRHTEPATGVTQHGFLNVMLAVACLLDGGSDAQAAVALQRRDVGVASDLVARGDLAEVRHLFTSFGTCDVDTPVRELRRLGLLEEAAA